MGYRRQFRAPSLKRAEEPSRIKPERPPEPPETPPPPVAGKGVRLPPKKRRAEPVGAATPAHMIPNGVILAIDTARVSGWAVLSPGGLGWGTVDLRRDPREPEELCMRVILQAQQTRLRSILVLEKPFKGTNQGFQIGAWQQAWFNAGGVKDRVVLVHPSTWRARVLPRGSHALPRDETHRIESITANKIAKNFCGLTDGVASQDACAAICIAEWAKLDPGVVDKLTPKRKAKR